MTSRIHTFSMYMCHCHTTQSTDTVFIHEQKTWPHITIDKPWNTTCFDYGLRMRMFLVVRLSSESKIEESRLKNCIYIQPFKSGKLRLLGDEQYKTKQEDNWLVFGCFHIQRWNISKLQCEVHTEAFHTTAISDYIHYKGEILMHNSYKHFYLRKSSDFHFGPLFCPIKH